MATTRDYFPTTDRPALPPALRHARVVMLVWAAFALVWVVVATLTLAPSATGAGLLFGTIVPELVGGYLAFRIERLPRWPLLTVTIVEIVLATGGIVSGSVRGIVQLVVPVVVLILLLRGYRDRARPADPYAQYGATMVQYAALVVLAALILAGLATVVPGPLQSGTRTTICKIFTSGDCGTSTQAGKGNQPGAKNANTTGNNDNGGDKGGDKAKCHGFWGCAWHYTGGQVWGFAKGVGKSLWQMGDGLVTSIAHPTQFIKGIGYAISHPGQALKSIFLGDFEKDWKNGDYGEAIGDVFTNTGSLLIPYADIATAAGDAGKVGKLGELGKLGEAGDLGKAGKLGKLGDLAADGDRAAADASKAAKEGDLGKADSAAQKAEADAKKAEDQGRKDGCKIAALGGIRVPALVHFGGRFAAPAEEGCTPEEQKNIDEAEKAKKKAKADAWDGHLNNPDSLKGMDPEDVKKLIPDDWPSSPQKKGVGTKYVDPEKKGRQVLVEQGTPAKPGQTPNVHNGPYIKISQNGKVERIPLKGNPTL